MPGLGLLRRLLTASSICASSAATSAFSFAISFSTAAQSSSGGAAHARQTPPTPYSDLGSLSFAAFFFASSASFSLAARTGQL